MPPKSIPLPTIYCDGACSPNPGKGTWGAVILDPVSGERELSGRSAELETTNLRMELVAAIEALSTLPPGSRVQLYSDSRYLIDGMTTGFSYERAAARKGKTPRPRPNLDLWEKLRALDKLHSITWEWTKGHAGNPYNERADELANTLLLGHLILPVMRC